MRVGRVSLFWGLRSRRLTEPPRPADVGLRSSYKAGAPKGWRGRLKSCRLASAEGAVSRRLTEDKGNTAQFVGNVGDAFSAICCLQIFRFTSSKPSKSAIASDEKFIRLRTNSFVRYCLNSLVSFHSQSLFERYDSCLCIFSLSPWHPTLRMSAEQSTQAFAVSALADRCCFYAHCHGC